MDTSTWTYEEKKGTATAKPSTVYDVPIANATVAVWCDAEGVFHVPSHLAAEVVAWLERQELLEPAPDLQGRKHAPKDDE